MWDPKSEFKEINFPSFKAKIYEVPLILHICTMWGALSKVTEVGEILTGRKVGLPPNRHFQFSASPQHDASTPSIISSSTW